MSNLIWSILVTIGAWMVLGVIGFILALLSMWIDPMRKESPPINWGNMLVKSIQYLIIPGLIGFIGGLILLGVAIWDRIVLFMGMVIQDIITREESDRDKMLDKNHH